MKCKKNSLLFPARHLTVSRKPGSRDTASLMLAGLWLEDAGFNLGDIVHLEVLDTTIIITKTNHIWVEEKKVVTKRKMVTDYGKPVRG